VDVLGFLFLSILWGERNLCRGPRRSLAFSILGPGTAPAREMTKPFFDVSCRRAEPLQSFLSPQRTYKINKDKPTHPQSERVSGKTVELHTAGSVTPLSVIQESTLETSGEL
jgi:hypothetical protein